MISDTDIQELQEIIATDYQSEIGVGEVRKAAESLVRLYSLVLGDKGKNGA
jgi:ubiquitin